jgi:peptidoglycan/LPS O-acetylase OafA/YrhL
MRTVSFSDWYLATVPILIGAGMLGFWVAAIVTHRVPEIESGGIEIRFHIAAETVTGLVLVAGGLAALIDPSSGWAIALSAVGLGMLMYTLIVSPGYYAERREWPLVWMFAVIWALTIPLVIFRLLGS